MCGIVGFITAEHSAGSYYRRKFFINALLAGTIRGDDGTGMFLVPRNHKEAADWCKLGDDASHFLRTAHASERITKAWDNYRAVIGHNRAATTGAISTANSHPFQEGPITLVHNGTLNSMYSLPTPKQDLTGVDVDSHVITHNLATHSVEEVVAELNGAFVLVWHDARDQSVNIVRNEKRPLHIMPAACEKTLLIASEAYMLEWLVRRANEFRPGPIYYPEPGLWLKFTPEHGIKPHVTKCALYAPKVYSYGSYSGTTTTTKSAASEWEQWEAEEDYANAPPWYRKYREEHSPLGERRAPVATEPPSVLDQRLQSKLPKGIKATLKNVALEPLDKIRFKVSTVMPTPGTKYCNVYGHLPDLSRMGIIQGLVYNAVKDCAETGEVWTALPVGVKELDGSTVNLVVMRLLKRSVTHTTAPLPSSTLSSVGPSPIDVDDLEEEDDIPMGDDAGDDEVELVEFLAPDGNEISFEEWAALVKDGCCMCGAQLTVGDAFGMEWDQMTDRPICPDCVDEMVSDEEDDEGEVASA